MLKFNLTQEGKTAIDALQGNNKLAITHVRLLNNIGGNSPVDLPVRSGAVVIDGTCNGPYVVVDVNDASDKNYLSDNIALLSDTKSIAELYSDEKASGYEVVLSAGMPGRNTYPSITYRTKTWASGKIPSGADMMMGTGDDCDIQLSFGSKGGDPNDPSQQEVSARITLGATFPNTITFSNGDVWETDETVSTAGIKTQDFSYGASSGDGDLSIRPLYSKISIQKESNKQLKLRLSCQFDGAEKCKFNTTSINLPYASRFREGVVRFTDTSNPWISDGQRYNTVYSAADVDKKISQVTSSLGNLNQYAKKAEANEFTAANTFTAGITVNGEISGNAVATTTANEKDELVVSVGFANNKYLSKTTAETAYLTKNEAGTIYLTKNEAGNTYLTQTVAADTYLSKTEANAAAENYAKLNGGNTFTGAKNTFQEVSATKFSGDGIVDAITANATQTNQSIPTDYAVKTYVDGKTGTLTQNITTLQDKDNELQSQIDGINAGQNLADIVNNTTELAGYDVSHLKAKGDYQHGESGDTWAIGDKVQVLGGADAQSCVYELVKGPMPAEGETGSIQSTNNTNYYWHYIGVYGTNAYTKSEIDTELAKKVDKTQIATTISDATATDENIPSASAVKTYVDTVANGLPNKYVTVDTAQEITGAKTFANGNITIANPNDAHKAKHYVTVGVAGDNTTSDYTSSIIHNDSTHNDYAIDQFVRARPNTDPNKSSDNVSYTRSLSRHGTNSYTFGTKLEQHIGKHYNYTASDMYMTTGDPNLVSPLPAAQIGTPGNKESTDDSLKENYVERIRLRKNTSVAGDTDVEFLPAGQSVTDIDLFADNINNVFNNEVSFRVCTTSGEGVKTDKSVLRIYQSGIWYRTQAGNTVGETEYQLRTAGSLDFETSITNEANDSHLPTSLAVKNYVATTVDDKIKDLQLGSSYLKLTSNDKQTVASNVDFNGTIGGTAVETQTINPDGTKLPTEHAVSQLVVNAIAENKNDTSDTSKVGAMGLFLYTGNDLKVMGEYVLGTSLQAVGMQLPMDGVVSWSQGDAMEGTWKLLNNTIAGEPCLVLAIRTA